jgi:hypothetical protein
MSGTVHRGADERGVALARQRRQQRAQQLEQRSQHYQLGTRLPNKEHQNQRSDACAARSQAGGDQ